MLKIQYLALESGYIVYGSKDGKEITEWYTAALLSDALDALCDRHPEFTQVALETLMKEESLREY
jgi:hypothetical protein